MNKELPSAGQKEIPSRVPMLAVYDAYMHQWSVRSYRRTWAGLQPGRQSARTNRGSAWLHLRKMVYNRYLSQAEEPVKY